MFIDWLNKLPDLWIALGLFFILLGIWLWTSDEQVFGFVSITFGVIMGFLKDRIRAPGPSTRANQPPTPDIEPLDPDNPDKIG